MSSIWARRVFTISSVKCSGFNPLNRLFSVIFASGAAASIVNSVLSPREESYLRFDYEHGTVEVSHLYGYRDDDWRVTPAPGHEQAVLAAWQESTAGTLSTAGTPSGHRAMGSPEKEPSSAEQREPATRGFVQQ